MTARDMALPGLAAPGRVVAATAARAAPALRERILLFVLFITVLASSVAFIEPSPHDVLMAVLAVACLVAGVRFERPVVVLFLLLLFWNVGGLLSLLNVPGQKETMQFAATSIYLALAAVLFACLFADNTMPRLATMRAAYILTAILSTLFGLACLFAFAARRGHFRMGRPRAFDLQGPECVRAVPGAAGAVSDPRHGHPSHPAVEARRGPCLAGRRVVLIFARRLVQFRAVRRRLAGADLPDRARRRKRACARSFWRSCQPPALPCCWSPCCRSNSVRHMMLERAQLTQSYDVGEGGRFELQGIALDLLFDKPFGLGPFAFSRSMAARSSITSTCKLSWSMAGSAASVTLC